MASSSLVLILILIVNVVTSEQHPYYFPYSTHYVQGAYPCYPPWMAFCADPNLPNYMSYSCNPYWLQSCDQPFTPDWARPCCTAKGTDNGASGGGSSKLPPTFPDWTRTVCPEGSRCAGMKLACPSECLTRSQTKSSWSYSGGCSFDCYNICLASC